MRFGSLVGQNVTDSVPGSHWPDRAKAAFVRRCIQANTRMSETLSIRIDSETKQRLDALSKRSKRSKSFLAAAAITAYVESEEWQLGEIHAGIGELESGQTVSHEKVSKWLKSWGTRGEIRAPR
jgi:RHH-type rel operon transcriptional repressor/antitoxin RelB